jgi:hypothetical protein
VRRYAPDRFGQLSDTISYFDWLITNGKKKPENPAGFLIALVQDELPVGARKAPEQSDKPRVNVEDLERHSRDELDYTSFVEAAVNGAIRQMGQLALTTRIEEKVAEFATSEHAATYKRWTSEMLRRHAELFVRKDIARDLALPDFEQWRARRST